MLWKCSFIIVFTFTAANRLSIARVCGVFMMAANIYSEYLDISMTRREAPCRHQTDSSLRLLVILFCVCLLQPGSGPGGVIYIIHIIHVSGQC